MLVLTRKVGQSIMVGDEIEIFVLSITAEKVRIGIEAPRSVLVLRNELYLDMRSDEVEHGGVAAGDEARDLR